MVRSKTSQGFIANFAAAGQKSLDRTEPMIGAKVLLELYRKFNDKWIVDLLLNDLIDWHDWFATYRILQPKGVPFKTACKYCQFAVTPVSAGLICLGSNPVDGDSYWAPNTLNSAKLESGLDNSPSALQYQALQTHPCVIRCKATYDSALVSRVLICSYIEVVSTSECTDTEHMCILRLGCAQCGTDPRSTT